MLAVHYSLTYKYFTRFTGSKLNILTVDRARSKTHATNERETNFAERDMIYLES